MAMVRGPLRSYFFRFPFFSSCESTAAAKLFCSAGVGFFFPERTFDARVSPTAPMEPFRDRRNGATP